MDIGTTDNVEEIIENWDHPIQPEEEDNLYKLLTVLASENDRLDIELDSLYDNRFLSTATGKELEKIGDLVGINRKTDEGDEKLRKRIRGAFAANASDTTYESFANTTISILEGGPNTIGFVTPPESPSKTVRVEIDGSLLEQSPLTENELKILLKGALSVDANLEIQYRGTFGFEGDDDSLKGFDEGTWSVGVNQ